MRVSRKFNENDSGATMVEYAVALLIVIFVGSVTITNLANAVGDELSDSVSAF